jgi:hypothetical protein
VTNPYRGINAHYNSWLQNETGEWAGFHNMMITHLHHALRRDLRSLGYTVKIEQSLQIRADAVPRSDLLIYDALPSRPNLAPSVSPYAIPLLELVDSDPSEDYYAALVIKRHSDKEPVVWIELLSPTNKQPNAGYQQYVEKRDKVLHSGLGFIEIDFLHQQPPTWKPRIADYSRGQTGAFPYHIIVIPPHQELETASAQFYGFHVNEPLPTATIYLLGTDTLDFDFDAPYQRLLEEAMPDDDVDYEDVPLGYKHYSAEDRARIQGVMQEMRTN